MYRPLPQKRNELDPPVNQDIRHGQLLLVVVTYDMSIEVA